MKAFLAKLSLSLPPIAESQESIWIHVVSVGEALAVKKLIMQLKSKTSLRIVISTTTLTGNRVAQKLYSDKADVIFFPFDITFALRRIIRKIRPLLFVAVETEMWPNLFYRLKRLNIPIVILNGRISDKAYRKYMVVKFFVRKILQNVSCIGVQTAQYKQRFLSLGADESKIVVSGNMKFESLEVSEQEIEIFRKKYEYFLHSKATSLLIAASTHSPEERIILDAYKELLSSFDITLLIAPRHPERVREIEKLIVQYGFCPRRMSNAIKKPDAKTIFVLDTVGELFYFYSISDICFVGGSLAHCGGHNILEPVYFSKPTVFGPHMNNFQEIEDIVLSYNAAIKINNSDDLKGTILKLLTDTDLRERLSMNSWKVFDEEKRFLAKNTEIILSALEKHD